MLYSRRQILDQALAVADEFDGVAGVERFVGESGVIVLAYVVAENTEVWRMGLYVYKAGDSNSYDVSEHVLQEANDYLAQRAVTP